MQALPVNPLARSTDESAPLLTTPSPAITYTVSAGTFGPTATTETSPGSPLYVTAAGTLTGICIRFGGETGVCQCAHVVTAALGGGHISASSSAYSIKDGAQGSGTSGQSYTVAPIFDGVISFASTGDVHVGSGPSAPAPAELASQPT